ncbi:MAG: lipid asymmetry maintenance ABC transporter permease subunit MlaE [Legionellaceae bacterium]|nr:lipid asymmetry maintenance ABC transporter permease subunit MlaE [Legionellaceae bacterium]
MNMNKLIRLGEKTQFFCGDVGRFGVFFVQLWLGIPRCKRLFSEVITQVFKLGVLSFSIVAVSAIFIGMVVGLQGYHTLEQFGATAQLGQLLALSVTRELAPVITALLFAGRAGSALTAEIGLMKATEQLASMEMMGVDPVARVLCPRWVAGMLSMPLLGMFFAVLAIYGGYVIGVLWLGIDNGSFWSNMQNALQFRVDILSGIIKSFVFGVLVVWIALFQGVNCTPTADGISQATTRTVVYGSLSVLAFDFLLTAMMIRGW